VKNKTRNNKGFSILFLVIPLAVISIATIWYLKVPQKHTTVVPDSEAQKLSATTTDDHSELEQLKQEVAILKKQQKSSTQASTKAYTSIPSSKQEPEQHPAKSPVVNMEQKNFAISAAEISPYITGVIDIRCGFVRGSGSLWKSKLIVTNAHVVEETAADGSCVVYSDDAKGSLQGIYKIYPRQNLDLTDKGVDAAIIAIQPADSSLTEGIPTKPIDELNYNISTLPFCDSSTPIGSPVIVIGYPASGSTSLSTSNGIEGTISSRIITNGIVSGYAPKIDSKYANYFVSAKIDSGNSGGIAFSKDANGLCVLGIPTWLNVGNYDTQGMIQNIQNIMSKM
jgi:S1-C subfamily serine protease